MGDLDRARWEVELEVAGSVAGRCALGLVNVVVKGYGDIRGERVDLLLIG